MRRCIATYGRINRIVDYFTSISEEQETVKLLADYLFLIELALSIGQILLTRKSELAILK
jgi:hypothetical protein